MKNDWFGKIIRIMTSFLPVSSARRGKCRNCGACCEKNPTKCLFLRYDANKKSYCYLRRTLGFNTLQCRKYPRIANEQVLGYGKANCGYYFIKEDCKESRHVQLGFKRKLIPVFVSELADRDYEIIKKIKSFLSNKNN
jgi:hypothetical protein